MPQAKDRVYLPNKTLNPLRTTVDELVDRLPVHLRTVLEQGMQAIEPVKARVLLLDMLSRPLAQTTADLLNKGTKQPEPVDAAGWLEHLGMSRFAIALFFYATAGVNKAVMLDAVPTSELLSEWFLAWGIAHALEGDDDVEVVGTVKAMAS